ncbi:MAG: hypothetical protein ACOCX3_02060 [Chloroflexota bacterium]
MLAGFIGGCGTETPLFPQGGPSPAVEITASPGPPAWLPWRDASDLTDGICFEAALDAAGQVFVLRTETELNYFYTLADNSLLCRWPVERETFDFSGGRVVAGLWTYGTGCNARHDLLSFVQNVDARTIDIRLALITSGDCPYELLQPFWITLENAADYTINITVE